MSRCAAASRQLLKKGKWTDLIFKAVKWYVLPGGGYINTHLLFVGLLRRTIVTTHGTSNFLTVTRTTTIRQIHIEFELSELLQQSQKQAVGYFSDSLLKKRACKSPYLIINPDLQSTFLSYLRPIMPVAGISGKRLMRWHLK